MLAELIAFTLQCSLPSGTPITITKNYEPITTCATILSEPPPNIEWPNPCEGRDNCHYMNNDTPTRYTSWQAYCDAQTVRPCSYPSGHVSHLHDSAVIKYKWRM